MTTDQLRKQTQELTERNHTADERRAGAVERGELASYEQAVLERAADLACAGYLRASRDLVTRELRGN